MGQRFKFNILTGENAQDKYNAIAVKDPMTFYLLETGVGYFRGKKLFGYEDISTIDTINEENPSNGIPTEKAIVNYVIEALRDKVPYEIDGEPGDNEETGAIRTYDTEDGWHVRKYTDGYAEISYVGVNTNWDMWFERLWVAYPQTPELPISFTEIYSVSTGTIRDAASNVGNFIAGSYDDTYRTVFLMNSQPSGICKFTIRISGRWK